MKFTKTSTIALLTLAIIVIAGVVWYVKRPAVIVPIDKSKSVENGGGRILDSCGDIGTSNEPVLIPKNKGWKVYCNEQIGLWFELPAKHVSQPWPKILWLYNGSWLLTFFSNDKSGTLEIGYTHEFQGPDYIFLENVEAIKKRAQYSIPGGVIEQGQPHKEYNVMRIQGNLVTDEPKIYDIYYTWDKEKVTTTEAEALFSKFLKSFKVLKEK